MNCMKCGREIAEEAVFCESCLEDMRKYPVKPGIAVQLPGKKDAPVPRKSHTRRRQPPTPEEQIQMRLERARWEMDQNRWYDYIVTNDQVETCADEILKIIANQCDGE